MGSCPWRNRRRGATRRRGCETDRPSCPRRFRMSSKARRAAFGVVGMQSPGAVDRAPSRKRRGRVPGKIRDHFDEDVFHAFLVERERKVMMIDEVVALLRPEDDGIMCFPRNSPFLFDRARWPVLALFLHLRMPTVIGVGRRLLIETGLRTGSRTTTMHGSGLIELELAEKTNRQHLRTPAVDDTTRQIARQDNGFTFAALLSLLSRRRSAP